MRFHSFVFGLALFGFLASHQAASSEQPRHQLEVTRGVMLTLPSQWTMTRARFKNAFEIVVAPSAVNSPVPRARMLVTTEHRRSHEEALRRLWEIAQSSDAAPVFLQIGGWPATQSIVIEPWAVAFRETNPKKPPRSLPESMKRRVTTAIAAGDLLLRTDTDIALQEPALADQAKAIPRTVVFAERGNSSQTEKELGNLRRAWREKQTIPVVPSGFGRVKSGQSLRPLSSKINSVDLAPQHDPILGPGSEIAIAVSSDAQNVVIVTNNNAVPGRAAFFVSNDAGMTFSTASSVPPPSALGDPSATFGQSGSFYISTLGLPTGAAGSVGGPAGCTASVYASANLGKSFAFVGNPAFCSTAVASGGSLCFPDQPFVSADAVNPATPNGAGDQLYEVWRNFTTGSSGTCATFFGGSITPTLTCSVSSGLAWTPPIAIGPGDLPRITVGSDGFVYVVIRDDKNVMLYKFNSCRSNLALVPGFPVTVDTSPDPARPMPGLDRTYPSALANATVAVDDTNPAHIYVAYAQSYLGNENIVVQQSFDGGLTFTSSGVANNPNVATRRFMPWACTTNGMAFVSWYDRRLASLGSNDITDFYLGAVSAVSPQNLMETRLSTASDLQCTNGWAGGSDDDTDSTSCTSQPQIAGHCYAWFSGTDFDFGRGPTCDIASNHPCTGTSRCSIWGKGFPEYGDYNEVACAGGKVFTAWASNSTRSGALLPNTFASVVAPLSPRQVMVTEVTQPANDGGQFNVQIDNQQVAANLGNGQSSNPVSLAPGTHQVQDSSANGVLMTDYATTFGGDCTSSGQVSFSTIGSPLSCTITHATAAGGCQTQCSATEASCQQNCSPGPECQQCVSDYNSCVLSCPAPPARAWLTVTMTVVPSTDMTAFAIWLGDQDIANRTIVNNTQIGQLQNGQSVGPIAITPADPNERGPHIVTVVGPGNFTYQFGGDCGPSQGTGQTQAAVDFGSGFGGTCAVTATHN